MDMIEMADNNKVSGKSKAIIYGGVAAGVIGIGAYAVYELTVVGGSCTTPGSACYTAEKPYETEFNSCFNSWSSLMSSYIAEDSKAGTGITAPQQSILDEYSSCYNSAAANIAKTASTYNQNPIVIITYFVGAIGLTLALLYEGPRAAAYYRKYMASAKSPPAAANGFTDGSIQQNIENGNLPPDESEGMQQSAQDSATQAKSDVSDFYNNLADEDIITADEAASAIEADQSVVEDDLDEIDALFE